MRASELRRGIGQLFSGERVVVSETDFCVASPCRADWSTTTKNCALLLFRVPSRAPAMHFSPLARGETTERRRIEETDRVPPRNAYSSRPIGTGWWIGRVLAACCRRLALIHLLLHFPLRSTCFCVYTFGVYSFGLFKFGVWICL